MPMINEMEVRGIVVGVFMENCYIVASPKTKEAIVIDPGDEPERVLQLAKDMGVHVKLIANSHAHIDHILGVRGIQEETKAPFLLHSAEVAVLEQGVRQLSLQGRLGDLPPQPTGFVTEGDTVGVAGLDLKVIHTPGHTPGSISYYVNGLLFSGDTLFRGSIGRTDSTPDGFQRIMDSIVTKLLALPDDTIVLPGHELETTIRQERATNPFVLQALRARDRRERG
ncbi:MAG: MBL fold metallo-hydrolase [Dehalococcoidia bacterium]|nr:MBL fold metallo-hydrolase [Dehalococcoidia bacterium]